MKTVWKILGWVYYPVYIIFWVLHKVARILLAVTYLGMLNGKWAKDIIKHIFVP